MFYRTKTYLKCLKIIALVFLSWCLCGKTSGQTPRPRHKTQKHGVKNKMDPDDTQLLNQLEKATDGLLFMSESDYPLTPFVWDKQTGAPASETILKLTNHPADMPVETESLDTFFRNAVRTDLYPPDKQDIPERFQKLVTLLKEHLADIKVFRLGTISIDVYVVGKTKSGAWAGVATKVIET